MSASISKKQVVCCVYRLLKNKIKSLSGWLIAEHEKLYGRVCNCKVICVVRFNNAVAVYDADDGDDDDDVHTHVSWCDYYIHIIYVHIRVASSAHSPSIAWCTRISYIYNNGWGFTVRLTKLKSQFFSQSSLWATIDCVYELHIWCFFYYSGQFSIYNRRSQRRWMGSQKVSDRK